MQLAQMVEAILQRLITGLPEALRSGDVAGRVHAQKLTTCIQASPF